MTPPDWARQRVAKATAGYGWNGWVGKSQVDLRAVAARLLRLEHARAVRVVNKFETRARRVWEASPRGGAKEFTHREVNLLLEQVCFEIKTALQRGRTNKKGSK